MKWLKRCGRKRCGCLEPMIMAAVPGTILNRLSIRFGIFRDIISWKPGLMRLIRAGGRAKAQGRVKERLGYVLTHMYAFVYVKLRVY